MTLKTGLKAVFTAFFIFQFPSGASGVGLDFEKSEGFSPSGTLTEQVRIGLGARAEISRGGAAQGDQSLGVSGEGSVIAEVVFEEETPDPVLFPSRCGPS